MSWPEENIVSFVASVCVTGKQEVESMCTVAIRKKTGSTGTNSTCVIYMCTFES